MGKKKVLSILVVLLFILLVTDVLGVGLSSFGDLTPTRIDFEPNLIRVYKYKLTPTVDYTTDYDYIAKGDLAEYIFFDPAELRQISPNEQPLFKLVLRLPESDEGLEPGMHNIQFGVVEGSTGGATVGAVTSIIVTLPVRVLHPGKYLVAALEFKDIGEGEKTPILLKLDNWGKIKIEEVNALIEVYEEGVLKDTFYTETTSVEGGGSSELRAVLDTEDYTVGTYLVKAKVNWDGNQTMVEKELRIGELDVSINKIQKEMEIGKINPFTIEVESGWNSPIQNVYFMVDLKDKNMQSPTTALGGFASKNLTAYFDTTGMKAGEYDGELKLFYDGRTKKKQITIKLVEEMGAEPEVEEVEEPENEEPSSFPYVTAAIIAILTMVIGILIANMIKKKRGELEDEEE